MKIKHPFMDGVDQLILVGLHQLKPYREIVGLLPPPTTTRSPYQPGTSLRSVQRRIKRLEDEGYVEPQNNDRKNLARKLTAKGNELVDNLTEGT